MSVMRRALPQLVTAALAGVVAVSLPAPAALAADAPPPPVVSELTLQGPPGRLVGAQVGYLDVSVHLTDAAGVPTGRSFFEVNDFEPVINCPCVQLVAPKVLGQASIILRATLRRTTGTGTDGTWTAHVPVTAAAAGTWRVQYLGFPARVDHPENAPGSTYTPPKTAVPTVPVNGSDPVVLSVRPVGRGTVERTSAPVAFVVSASLASSHRPVVGARLLVRTTINDDLTILPSIPTTAVRTNAQGQARWSVPGTKVGGLFTVERPLRGAVAFGGFSPGESVLLDLAPFTGQLTARPAVTSVRAGRNIAVTGSTNSSHVVLQRRVSGRWSSVGEKYLDCVATCSYRLTATPPKGTWSYRVVQTAGANGSARAATRAFTLRGV